MASLAAMAQSVRLRLSEPRPQKPSGRAVLQAVCTKTQSKINQLGISGQPWAIDELILNVVGNQSDYLLPVTPYFGKVLQVLTYYPQNLGIPTRYVEFTQLNDLNYDWPYPVNVASYMFTDGSPNTAMRIAFYRKGGEDNMWCRVLPMPQLAAQYLVTYSVGSWSDDAGLESSPVLSQFHPLIEIQSALSLLPLSEWEDDPKLNISIREQLKESLLFDQAEPLDDWQRYIRSLTSDHLSTRDGASGAGGWY